MARKSLAEAFKKSSLEPSGKSTTGSDQLKREDRPQAESGIVEMVPGSRGKLIPADEWVNMTFKVTAKERYLWNLALSKQGKTGISVLREAMNELLDD